MKVCGSFKPPFQREIFPVSLFNAFEGQGDLCSRARVFFTRFDAVFKFRGYFTLAAEWVQTTKWRL